MDYHGQKRHFLHPPLGKDIMPLPSPLTSTRPHPPLKTMAMSPSASNPPISPSLPRTRLIFPTLELSPPRLSSRLCVVQNLPDQVLIVAGQRLSLANKTRLNSPVTIILSPHLNSIQCWHIKVCLPLLSLPVKVIAFFDTFTRSSCLFCFFSPCILSLSLSLIS